MGTYANQVVDLLLLTGKDGRKISGGAHWIREEKASDGLSIVLAPPWH